MKKMIKIVTLLVAVIALLVFDVELPIVGIPTDIIGFLIYILRASKQMKAKAVSK